LKPVKPVDNTRGSGNTERSVPPLIKHLEQHLGPLAAGWRRDVEGRELPFQVALFENAPGPGNITLTTVGLSKFPLEMNDGRTVHQELVFACHERFQKWNPQIILQSVGRHAVDSRHALHRGQCMGPLKLFAQSEANGLYSAIPVYFPDSFNSVELGGSTRAVLTWLVPLYPSELDWCRRHGWSSLEAEFARQDPDLMDLQRMPLSLPN
jgi:Suppressor of fused protein (SUFU)